ncbi:tyrosine-type recombinase/integrase [Paracoccus solventivorans]|uniref:tyrosine-type recombinase/integrase n=1 Tax=Paracoccus solventivorans TaxID=53463 RepID=UPI0009344D91|nr:tyrosine-type recombinase/integrase [Paracoccus solventivorans]
MSSRQNVKSDADCAADSHERGRNYLGQPQIDRLLASAKKGRHGIRDHLLLLMMFRHGLRVSEAIGLRRENVDLAQSRVWM